MIPNRTTRTSAVLARPSTAPVVSLGSSIANALAGIGMRRNDPPVLTPALNYASPSYAAVPGSSYYAAPFQQQQHQMGDTVAGLRTTAEGYSISTSYEPPPPPPPSFAMDRPTRGRGRGRGRGESRGGRGGSTSTREGAIRGRTGTNRNEIGQNDQDERTNAPIPPPSLQKACSLPGCKFEGSQKLVREHEEDRHLLFAPGREPKPFVQTYGAASSARIEGSSISLDSPEAIAKWIADRKKRWPSSKVVEEKEKLRAERVAAGLEPAFSSRGRGGRGRGNRGADRGDRGRGGRERGSFSQRNDDPEERSSKRMKLEDEATTSGSSSDDSDDEAPVASTSKATEPFVPTKSVGLVIHPSRMALGDAAESETKVGEKEFNVVCKHWRKGKCGLGSECPFLHELPNRVGPSALPPRRRPAPPAAPQNPFARPDPFSQFAERDIAHLTAEMLQVIEFLSKNRWLKGVELVAGTIEEATHSIVEVESDQMEVDRDGKATREEAHTFEEQGANEDDDEEEERPEGEGMEMDDEDDNVYFSSDDDDEAAIEAAMLSARTIAAPPELIESMVAGELLNI